MDDNKETVNNIKKYLSIINKQVETIEKDNVGLIDFVINEVIDRVELYLNSETIPTKIERVLSSIVNNGLKKCLKDIEISKEDSTTVDQVITSISDNGQSISYANEVTKYFTTSSDEELFTGFTGLLSRYRRIKVVYPKDND
jgi:signal transduction histidine kinase